MGLRQFGRWGNTAAIVRPNTVRRACTMTKAKPAGIPGRLCSYVQCKMAARSGSACCQSIHRLFIDAEPISYICSGGLHGNKAQEGQPCLNILRRIFLDIGTSQCLNGRQLFDQCMFFDHFLYFGSDLRFSRTRCPSQLRQPGPDRSPLRRRRRRIPYSLLPDNCRSAARHPRFSGDCSRQSRRRSASSRVRPRILECINLHVFFWRDIYAPFDD